jgi:hypothetical protein
LEAIDVQPAEQEPPRSAIQSAPSLRSARPRAEDDSGPKRRRPKLRREEARGLGVSFEPGWFGSMNAGVIGGLLMILIAVVWFVVGLAGGIIFFYPPVLAVIGLIAIAKGLSGGN